MKRLSLFSLAAFLYCTPEARALPSVTGIKAGVTEFCNNAINTTPREACYRLLGMCQEYKKTVLALAAVSLGYKAYRTFVSPRLTTHYRIIIEFAPEDQSDDLSINQKKIDAFLNALEGQVTGSAGTTEHEGRKIITIDIDYASYKVRNWHFFRKLVVKHFGEQAFHVTKHLCAGQIS